MVACPALGAYAAPFPKPPRCFRDDRRRLYPTGALPYRVVALWQVTQNLSSTARRGGWRLRRRWRLRSGRLYIGTSRAQSGTANREQNGHANQQRSPHAWRTSFPGPAAASRSHRPARRPASHSAHWTLGADYRSAEGRVKRNNSATGNKMKPMPAAVVDLIGPRTTLHEPARSLLSKSEFALFRMNTDPSAVRFRKSTSNSVAYGSPTP